MLGGLVKKRFEGAFFLIVFLVVFFGFFGYMANVMGTENMMNTIMKTAYDLLMKTVFYIMAITVLAGALGKIMIEFGVVRLLEFILAPLMRPLFNLPGVASLGALMAFFSDNPAIISLAKDKNFCSYFKKYELISMTNFGTAFGMGLVVMTFMMSLGKSFVIPTVIGLVGAIIGGVISTRLMQKMTKPIVGDSYVTFKGESEEAIKIESEDGPFLRLLNSVLDGGKMGVDLGLAIIPGVLIISTFIMMITFGPSANGYTGAAYEGVPLLPEIAGKIKIVFSVLFGFERPEFIAFPITSLGAVGAAMSLVPKFKSLITGNEIAVFTAMGMCWSGFLSTHTAMLDALGYRNLISRAILSHTIGGLFAGICAHYLYVLVQHFS